MSLDLLLLVAVALLLLTAAALFRATETGVQRITHAQVDQAVRTRPTVGAPLAAIVADRARVTRTLMLLSTFFLMASAGTAYIVVDALTGWSAPATALVVALVITGFAFVIVDVGGRTLGRQHSLAICRAMARPVKALAHILAPLSRLLILLGNVITPGRGYPQGPFDTEDELREMIDQASGVIEDDERQMIQSVFELGDTLAREVMVPRTEVVFIDAAATLRDALSLALRSGFSRIPVIIDGPDDVVGVAYLKDVARRIHESAEGAADEHVDAVMRQAYFVPDSKDAEGLLREMQANRVHLAIVVDEFGGTAGLVTIEDILEEIVGEITDEYDTGAPELQRLPDGSLRVSARLNVEDFADAIGITLDGDAEGVESVGGLMASRLGTVPIPGSRVREQGWDLVAESAEGRRKRIGTIVCRRADVGQEVP